MPGKIEIAKDVMEVAVQSGAERVGRIAGAVTRTVGEITGEVGGWFTDIFEMMDAADRAEADREADEADDDR